VGQIRQRISPISPRTHEKRAALRSPVFSSTSTLFNPGYSLNAPFSHQADPVQMTGSDLAVENEVDSLHHKK